MTVVLYLVMCLTALTFLGASLVRAARYARAPLHLRWELYPVAHEPAERAGHGGSYFETHEWWRHPRRFSWAGELRFMIPEMLLLNGLRVSNPVLWRVSFPFHFGLYLLGGTCALILGAAVATRAGAPSGLGALASAMQAVYPVTGWAGLLLTMAGAGGLLHRRLTDPGLRLYTTPGDIFNLLFFLVGAGLAGLAALLRPAGSPGPRDIVAGLLSFDTELPVAPLFAAGLIPAALLVAYIPLTHMSHFVAKYFTYHAVRWDDTPMQGNRRIAKRMAQSLTYRPTWAAPHIAGDGQKTWQSIASSDPPGGGRP